MHIILTENSNLVNWAKKNGEQVVDLSKFDLKPFVSQAEYASAVRFIPQRKNVEDSVTDLLLLLGIPASIKGFAYLKFSLCYLLKDENFNCLSMTKFLYPDVAKEFKTTSSRVERSIRHAIEIALSKGTIDEHPEIFGTVADKITNSPFVHALKVYLKRQISKVEA